MTEADNENAPAGWETNRGKVLSLGVGSGPRGTQPYHTSRQSHAAVRPKPRLARMAISINMMWWEGRLQVRGQFGLIVLMIRFANDESGATAIAVKPLLVLC